MATTIYGASDDLIEVDGDITEEFDGDSYSDRATITEPVEWVVCGHEWGKR